MNTIVSKRNCIQGTQFPARILVLVPGMERSVTMPGFNGDARTGLPWVSGQANRSAGLLEAVTVSTETDRAVTP